jgi:hypothetical protein
MNHEKGAGLNHAGDGKEGYPDVKHKKSHPDGYGIFGVARFSPSRSSSFPTAIWRSPSQVPLESSTIVEPLAIVT